MTVQRSDWSDARLDQLEQIVRAFAPTSAQIAGLEATMEAVEEKVDRVEKAVDEGRKSVRNTLLLILGPVATTGVIAFAGVIIDKVA